MSNVERRYKKYELISPNTFTFEHDGTVLEGDMVGLVERARVGRAGPGVRPFGKAIRVGESVATVVYAGLVTARYSGPTPLVGVGVQMTLDGAGGVSFDPTLPIDQVTNVDVIDVDEENGIVVVRLK